jgi:hypothetical protein
MPPEMWAMVDRIAQETGRDWPEIVRGMLSQSLLLEISRIEAAETKALVRQKLTQRQGEMELALKVLESSDDGAEVQKAIADLRRFLSD